MEAAISNRLIGIEIEAVAPIIGTGSGEDVQRLLAQILTNQGIPSVARSYTQQSLPPGVVMAIEHDNSLRDEQKYSGLRWSRLECKTMPMTWQQINEVLPRALEIIMYCGSRINFSCGLHTHLHFPEVFERPEVVRNIQHLWWRYHKVIYGLVAPSRKSNSYCCPPNESDATRFDDCRSYASLCRELERGNRYSGLNVTNLTNRQKTTVEWRIHQGSLEWSKIKAWVLATQRWVEHAVARSCHFKPEPLPNTQESLNSLLVTTGLKPNSRIYRKVDKEIRSAGKFLLRRWKHFNLPREFKKKAEAA